MKVLMLSIDKGLLGKGQLGDVIERHRRYGESVDKLDIIVFCGSGFSQNKISDKAIVYPTNSKNRLNYFFDGLGLGRKLFKENKYDLIVTQEPFITGLVGYKLKRKFGGKLLIHFHGDFWQNPNWLKENRLNFFFLLLSKFIAPRADAIRVMSQGQKDKLVKAGIDEKKIRVISTPVDLEKYKYYIEQLEKEEPRRKEVKRILHVSRYDKVKDFCTLFKTIALVQQKKPEVLFWQVGAGESQELQKIIDEFNKSKPDIWVAPLKNIERLGIVAPKDLIKFYYLSDVVVSTSRSESFGKVLVEANACGKPVVSTATTGAKEIIRDGYNGFLAPIGDAEALAEKILYLLNNPEKAKEMGENGRKLVWEKFSGEANTKQIVNFWREVIKSDN